KSMLATDVQPNRLTRAKSQIAALLDNLSTNRVGIVAFAGDATVMCPLTPDVDAAKLFLDIIDPDNMPKPGTNIQRAVEAVASLLAERLLLVMAKATDGRYFRSQTVNLNQLVASLEQLRKRSIGGGEYVEYEERYQAFLLPAFLLIYLGLLMSDRRGAWFAW